MCQSMVDIQPAEIRRGKKKIDKKKSKGKNIMSASATQGGHNKEEKLKKNKKQIRSEETVRSRVGSLSVRVSVIAKTRMLVT